MTMAPERPSISRSGAGRRSGSASAQVAVACVAVAGTMVFVVLWALSARELGDSRAEAVDLTGRVQQLKDQVASADEELLRLQRELTAAQEAAESGIVDLDEQRTELQNRILALDEREQDLDDREREVDELAAQLEALEQELADAARDPRASGSGLSLPAGDEAVLVAAEDVVSRIAAVDRHLADRTAVLPALTRLAESLERLALAGAPSQLDADDYDARLAQLAQVAGSRASYPDVRAATGKLLAELEEALDSDLRLP